VEYELIFWRTLHKAPLKKGIFKIKSSLLAWHYLSGYQHSSKYILFCSTEEETHAFLEQHEGE